MMAEKPSGKTRSDRVHQIVADYLARKALGEDVHQGEILSAHPDLMPELGEELDRIAQIEAAGVPNPVAATNTADANPDSPAAVSIFDKNRPQAPKQIGPYRILERVGEGGMGVVYRAHQTKPVQRDVALKLIKLGMDSKSVIARFEAERQALAMMNHPAIAKVFDAGVTEQGRPFFAMEFVQGLPITEHCDRHKLTIDERLDLFMQVCHAVQHAHQKGIIHRDIKPSNVLVEYADGKAVPKIIDFGVAKAMNQRLTEHTLFTEQGQMVGTPAYMSPEQADLSTQDIDTRSDIYSLGVLLYELLTGSLPFDSRALRSAGLAEIQRVIREEEPPKPSTRLGSLATASPDNHPVPAGQQAGAVESDIKATALPIAKPSVLAKEKHATTAANIAKSRRSEVRTLIRKIRGDLDWIVMKCLEKDRSRRYESANGLAMDLQRHLSSEPVLAGPPSVRYRATKFVKRNKAAVILGTTVALVLVTATVVSLRFAAAERTQRERADGLVDLETQLRQLAEIRQKEAESARDEADAVTKFLTDTLAAVHPQNQGFDVSVREVLDGAAPRIAEEFADSPLIQARLHHTVGWTYLGLGLLDEAKAHLADAAALYYRLKGERHPTTLRAVHDLCWVLRERGNFGAAEAGLIATLETQRLVLGDEHYDTLSSMNDLALLYSGQRRDAEAEALNVKTLELMKRVLGEEHASTLGSMSNLANLHRKQGRYAEAEALYVDVLEIMNRVLGEEAQFTCITRNHLADLYRIQGRYAEAEALDREVLAIQRRVLGEEHPDTLESMMGLAANLWHLQKFAESESIYREAAAIRRRVLGEEHPDTLRSLRGLAFVLPHVGKFAEGETIYRETLAIQRRVLGEEHPDTWSTMNNWALLYYKQGRYSEAEPIATRLVTSAKTVLQLDDPKLADYRDTYGRILLKLGRAEEAEPLLLDSYAVLSTVEHYRRDAGESAQALVELYESRHAAEPGKGYDVKTAEWRAKLAELEVESESGSE